MFYYYIFTLVASWMYFFNRKAGYYILLLGVPLFLLSLPTTGLDYDYYKESYDNATFISTFPFFESISSLTAEPLYVWYTSVISVLSQLEFPAFLALNFIFSAFLFSLALLNFPTDLKKYFFLFILPIIIPTLFYFSPRSSISFAFILIGFFKLCHDRKNLGILFLFIGFSFHTQYFLIGLYILLLYFLSSRKDLLNINNIVFINFVLALFLFLFLHFISFFENIVATVFSFLPSASVALAKLHYVSDEDGGGGGGFRLTGLLSVLIYPAILLYFLRTIKLNNYPVNTKFLFCLVGVVFFGIAVNIAFISEPHVAGRLSRFSDYFCMGFLIPYVLYVNKHYLSIKIISLVMCLLTPILFKTLYIGAFEIF
ncbi:hypothetical protein MWMV7_MWMV7_02786 [Acinetobacter calcoaceticus]|uniref:EpsG family protein n=1 Tax=Acinetobacter calcoaceticus TaxID=471 RepID=UPI0009ACEC68|nr:EpsG family protein [Acinetobacter calcoaceticus]AQZ80182.1 hypothetical protein BUM88_00220 [Acinetobacter calcoaceticus]CAI3153210.1 hypothetical protein MWMV7_MWMV7_02786 [Acinetobacter calcoaceticus]